jgi:hypothetical protein
MTLTGSSHKGGGFSQFRQVYCWQMKRGRMASILCIVLTLICFTAVHLCESVSSYHNYFDNPSEWGESVTQAYLTTMFSNSVAENLSTEIAVVLAPLLVVFLIVFSIQTFQYMHKRRSVDLFHALPVRRTPLLLGSMAAIGTVLGVVILLNLLICGCVDMALGAEGKYTLCWVLSHVGYLLLLTAASLCGTVFLLVSCGTVSGAVFAGILLTVGWPILVGCGAEIIRSSLPGSTLIASGAVLTALTPYLAFLVPYSGTATLELLMAYDTYDSTGSQIATVELWPVLWWVLVTILLFAGCILVYRRRKSEAAENYFAYPILRIVIRFILSGAVGLSCALFFGVIIDSNAVFYVTAVIASALVHLVTQIIWVRGTKQIAQSFIAYGALLFSMAVFFVGLATGGLGYVAQIPDQTEVDYIRVDLPVLHFDDSKETYLYSANHTYQVLYDSGQQEWPAIDGTAFSVEPKFQAAESVQTIQALHQTLIDSYDKPYLPVQADSDYTCQIKYYLKNGNTMVRVYNVPGYSSEMGDLRDHTTEPYGTPEILAAMAKVAALEEMQAFNPLDVLTADCITNVRMEQDDGETAIQGEMGEAITEKQQKKLLDTFLKELNSNTFAYTYREANSDSSDMSYYIEVNTEWSGDQWPESLAELVKKSCTDEALDQKPQSELTLSTDNNSYYIPRSCPKTRALIEEYIGDNVERSTYDDSGKDGTLLE